MSWNCTLKYNSIAPLVWGKEIVPQLCAFSSVETQLQPDSSEEYWLGTWHRQGQHSQPDPEERHRGRTRTSNLTSPGNTQECGDFTLNWGPLPFLLFNERPVPTEQAGFVVLCSFPLFAFYFPLSFVLSPLFFLILLLEGFPREQRLTWLTSPWIWHLRVGAVWVIWWHFPTSSFPCTPTVTNVLVLPFYQCASLPKMREASTL